MSPSNTLANVMSARTKWCLAAISIACLATGVALSHRVEPGVRVEAVTIAGDTPALKFVPANSGPHPVVLLAHGVTGSKEMFFRFGEALAAAGFVCVSVDLPGHGASEKAFSLAGTVQTLEVVTHVLGPVDVFIGHSMGANAGVGAVHDAGLNPRLFIAVGAIPDLGGHGPPLLLLAGRFEEFATPARLKARTDARVVISPNSDHAFELFDGYLVKTAVEAACTAIGRPSPASIPNSWRWRIFGMVLALLGAVVLALRLPAFPSRWALMRGPVVWVIVVGAFILCSGTWIGAMPHLRHIPLQIAAMIVGWLMITGAARLHLPRWSLVPLTVAAAMIFAVVGAPMPAFFAALFVLALLAGTILGSIAAHRGSRRDGDIAMAIHAGYVVGQWLPFPVLAFVKLLLGF